MARKLKMIDITKLKKATPLIQQETNTVLSEARSMLERQEAFMQEVGMDRDKLKTFINSEFWTPQQKQKAREELIRFHAELKSDMKQVADEKNKEVTAGLTLLSQNGMSITKSKPRKKRSNLI